MNHIEENCIEYIHMFSSYFEKELEDAENILFESHLEDCDGCSHVYNTFEIVINMFRSLEPLTLAPETEESLLNFLSDRCKF